MCKLSSQHTHTVNTRFHTGYKLITGTMLKSPTWSYIRRLAGHRIDDRKGSVHTVLRLTKASAGTWLRSARLGATPLRSAHSRSPDTQSQNSPSLENPPEAQSSSGVLLRHRTKNQRTTASCSVTGRTVRDTQSPNAQSRYTQSPNAQSRDTQSPDAQSQDTQSLD